VIGSPLSIGRVSEVVPVAPRADVRGPLVMERLLPMVQSPELLERTAEIAELARSLPSPWQRLVSADITGMENHLIYERFVGVTLREVSTALRTTGRVLPMDVLRSVVEHVCEGLSVLPVPTGHDTQYRLSDRSIGLSINGQWHFALGALNHWLVDVRPHELAVEATDPSSADIIFFLSPEGIAGRRQTAASFPSRAALFAWQMTTGGFHPYRGGRHETAASLTRYSRDNPRVPLTVHPQMTPALAQVLERGASFAAHRYADLAEFRAALDAVWPLPAATAERTLEVIASITWSAMQKELQTLKREPLLPIRWDGVWSASRTPEEGIAVLEDQLLERLEPLERFPRRGAFEESFVTTPPAPELEPELPAEPAPAPVQPREGFLQRLLALFRR
jgi:hypothetical protein